MMKWVVENEEVGALVISRNGIQVVRAEGELSRVFNEKVYYAAIGVRC